jgi:parallel beta-helix repeat protein
MRKTVVIVLLIALLALSNMPPLIAQSQTQNIVTINADGSITPPTAPIRQKGTTYTITGDFEGSLIIHKSNTTLNGDKHVISINKFETNGVELRQVTNVTVENLSVCGSDTGCCYGIALTNSSRCQIINNTVSDLNSFYALNAIPYEGIYVYSGSQNIISNNILSNDLQGLEFWATSDNLIVGNSVSGVTHSEYSSIGGINFYEASGNTVYHNNFWAAQGSQAGSSDSNNTWDNGFSGNYWADYKTRYPDAKAQNNSVIGNTAYQIDDVNLDRYPLTVPYSATPPTITMLSLSGMQYNESSVPLDFRVDNAPVWIGYSLDGSQNTTVVTNTTITDIPNGAHTLTVYANDSLGNVGSAVAQFSVEAPLSVASLQEFFPAIPVIILVVVVIVGAVYFGKRKHKPTPN